MSNIESLDRLREFVEEDAVLVSMIENVEHEIAERLIEPCDADGVPIKPGDVLDFNDFKAKCAAVSQERVYYWNKYRFCWTWENADKCHHFNPRTIEDVLHDFLNEKVYTSKTYERYADEIRELMGVSE